MDYDRQEHYDSSDSETSSLDIVLTDNEENDNEQLSVPYQNNSNSSSQTDSSSTEDLIFNMEHVSNSDLHSIATEEEDRHEENLSYLEYHTSSSYYSSSSCSLPKNTSPADVFYSPCPITIDSPSLSTSSNYQNEENDDEVMLSRSLGALEMGDYHGFSQLSHHGYSVLGTSLPNDVFEFYPLDFEKSEKSVVSKKDQTSAMGEKETPITVDNKEVPMTQEELSLSEKESVDALETEVISAATTTEERDVASAKTAEKEENPMADELDLQDESKLYEELPLNKESSSTESLPLKEEEDSEIKDEDNEKYEDVLSESSVTKDQDIIIEKISSSSDDTNDDNDSALTTLTEDILVQVTEPGSENTVQVESSRLLVKSKVKGEKSKPAAATTSTAVSIINNNQNTASSSSSTKPASYSGSYGDWFSMSQNYVNNQLPQQQLPQYRQQTHDTKRTFMKKNKQPNKQKIPFFVFRKTNVLKVIGLSFSTVFKDLQRHFYDSTILTIRYLRPLNTAYITFQNHYSMMNAIQKQDGTYLDGMMISCVPSSFKEMAYDANLPVKFKIQNFTSQITRTCVGNDCVVPCVFQYTPMQSYSSFTRYFIIKPKLMREVHFSSKYNYWYTNKRNFEYMNRLFKNTEDIYLIFSVTGSKALQGYARMKSSVINIKSAKREELFGTPFSNDKDIKFGANGKVWQYVYRIEWLMHGHVSLNSLSDLRNAWNSNSTVKTSVDYTQLEPNLGRFILQKFHT